jgi:hypothetical protein
MKRSTTWLLCAVAAAGLAACAASPTPPAAPATGPLSFFITSAGSGQGGNLGGLAGADAQCQKLAAAAGAGGKAWRAYLSVPGSFGSAATATAPAVPAVPSTHARDRIGQGPWFNAKGALIARDVSHLHTGNTLSKDTALAWTSNGDGSAIVGHHDRTGPLPDDWAKSWNFSHQSAGCSQEALVRTGGSGRFYCFASNLVGAAFGLIGISLEG